MQFYTILHSME